MKTITKAPNHNRFKPSFSNIFCKWLLHVYIVVWFHVKNKDFRQVSLELIQTEQNNVKA